MLDPGLNLQKAIAAILTGSSALTALVGDRIYDVLPTLDRENPSKSFPCIRFGDDDIEGAPECGPHSECFVRIHVFSDAPVLSEIKRINVIIRDLLDGFIAIEGFSCIEAEYLSTRFTNATPPQHHAVVEFRYLVQPTG